MVENKSALLLFREYRGAQLLRSAFSEIGPGTREVLEMLMLITGWVSFAFLFLLFYQIITSVLIVKVFGRVKIIPSYGLNG